MLLFNLYIYLASYQIFLFPIFPFGLTLFLLISLSSNTLQIQLAASRNEPMISQDRFFLPPAAPALISNTGFVPVQEIGYLDPNPNPNPNPDTPSGNNTTTNNNNKRKRNLPRTPDPEVEVVAMSPKTLMTTNRFICEICNKGFQRDQNLQLHRRGHNLPWKLKQKANKDQVKKKVYICPEKSCVHHDASRALGDLTGIKKHFSRKHGEKKWKCQKCSKKYAVMSDWKAHAKICGTREYKCDCGTIFSRKDSFITHRAFCDALTEERMRVNTNALASTLNPNMGPDLISGLLTGNRQSIPSYSASQRSEFLRFETSSSISGNNNNMGMIGDNTLASKSRLPLWLDHHQVMNNSSDSFLGSSSSSLGGSCNVLQEFSSANLNLFASSSSQIPQGSTLLKEEEDENRYHTPGMISLYSLPSSSMGNMSATALLQKAAQIGSTRSTNNSAIFASPNRQLFRQQMNGLVGLQGYSIANDQLPMTSNNMNTSDGMRDFLGTLGGGGGGARNGSNNGGEEERRMLLQEEMAYNLGTMAGSHAHQEPYKDLMR